MSDKSRRKILKSIAAGSGAIVAGKSLPQSWSRPVVDSVMLPAHAQTSGRIFSGNLSLQAFNNGQNESLFAEAFNILIPNASAGIDLPTIAIGCATQMGSVFDVWFQFGDDLGHLTEITGTLPENGTDTLNTVALCGGPSDSFTSRIVELTDDYIDIDLVEAVARIPLNTACVKRLAPDCSQH